MAWKGQERETSEQSEGKEKTIQSNICSTRWKANERKMNIHFETIYSLCSSWEEQSKWQDDGQSKDQMKRERERERGKMHSNCTKMALVIGQWDDGEIYSMSHDEEKKISVEALFSLSLSLSASAMDMSVTGVERQLHGLAK